MSDMKGLSVPALAAACGGELVGRLENPGADLSAVVIDSRTVTPGCAFAAIKGARADGHDFINAAFAAGAACCISEKRLENAAGPCVLVPSTEEALCRVAAYYRASLDIPVIGITGSVGKTTAKEMAASVLSQRFSVLKTDKNNNNNLGVPLTLLRVRPEHELAVVEMGISHFGEMSEMARVARPDMALFTVIGFSHLEYLGDRQGVFRAKTEMLEFMRPDAKIFINGDDELLSAMTCPQTKISYGLGEGCAVRAENIRTAGSDGMSCTIISGTRRIEVRIPAFGAHMVYAALEGAALGLEMGLTDEEISRGIAAYETVGRRARLEKHGTLTVVNDCYNSNPSSAASAVASLMTLPGRRVCILGDMLELGDAGPHLHRELGALAAEAGVDVIIACGTLSESIYAGARESGKQPEAWYFPNKDELLAALPALLKPNDAVLVKASNSMNFGEIAEAIAKLEL